VGFVLLTWKGNPDYFGVDLKEGNGADQVELIQEQAKESA